MPALCRQTLLWRRVNSLGSLVTWVLQSMRRCPVRTHSSPAIDDRRVQASVTRKSISNPRY